MERELREMRSIMDRAFHDLDWERLPANKTVYYGVSVEVGPDGIPHVREFGNVRPDPRGMLAAREPLMSVVEEPDGRQAHVTAELPGVELQDIKLTALQDGLRLAAASRSRTYESEIELEPGIDPASARATYRNGVLDVTLARRPSKVRSSVVPLD